MFAHPNRKTLIAAAAITIAAVSIIVYAMTLGGAYLLVPLMFRAWCVALILVAVIALTRLSASAADRHRRP